MLTKPAQHRHEADGKEIPRTYVAGQILFDEDEILHAPDTADGDHHSTPGIELFHQGRWDVTRCGSDYYRIEGCELRPAVVSVGVTSGDRGIPQALESLVRASGERFKDLDGIDLCTELTEHRRLISRPGTYLQHSHTRSWSENLRHVGNDIWLRDCLAVTDRQRMIAVSLRTIVRGNEFVSRYAPHRSERGRVVYATGRDEVYHREPLALARVLCFGPGCSEKYYSRDNCAAVAHMTDT